MSNEQQGAVRAHGCDNVLEVDEWVGDAVGKVGCDLGATVGHAKVQPAARHNGQRVCVEQTESAFRATKASSLLTCHEEAGVLHLGRR